MVACAAHTKRYRELAYNANMSIKIQVVVFAGLKDRLGWAEKELELTDGATVADAMKEVVSPELVKGLATAVNREYAKADVELKDGVLSVKLPKAPEAQPRRIEVL